MLFVSNTITLVLKSSSIRLLVQMNLLKVVTKKVTPINTNNIYICLNNRHLISQKRQSQHRQSNCGHHFLKGPITKYMHSTAPPVISKNLCLMVIQSFLYKQYIFQVDKKNVSVFSVRCLFSRPDFATKKFLIIQH